MDLKKRAGTKGYQRTFIPDISRKCALTHAVVFNQLFAWIVPDGNKGCRTADGCYDMDSWTNRDYYLHHAGER